MNDKHNQLKIMNRKIYGTKYLANKSLSTFLKNKMVYTTVSIYDE